MKNRIYIETLFCGWVFVFWAFVYPNHILFTEQLSLFLYSPDYWKQYALQPGGWAAYCGNFLAQFYINRWAGALIQTLLTVAMLATSREILRKAGGKGGWLPAGILPALFLMALQGDDRFTPGDTLAFIAPYALMLCYMTISNATVRRLASTLAMIPLYLFAGAGPTFCLYAACILYELLFAKDRWKYCTPLWLLAALFLPRWWQSFYLMPADGLYRLSFPPVEGIAYIPWLWLVFIPVCIVAVKVVARRPWFGTKLFSVVAFSVVLGCGCYLFQKSFNRLEEQTFAMHRATAQSDWERVLKISGRVKTPDHHTAYFTNLALSMQGELPQKIFHYLRISVLVSNNQKMLSS